MLNVSFTSGPVGGRASRSELVPWDRLCLSDPCVSSAEGERELEGGWVGERGRAVWRVPRKRSRGVPVLLGLSLPDLLDREERLTLRLGQATCGAELAPGGKALLKTHFKGILAGIQESVPQRPRNTMGPHEHVMLESRTPMLGFVVGLGWGGGKWPRGGPDDGGSGAWKENKKEVILGKEEVSGMSGEAWAPLSIL